MKYHPHSKKMGHGIPQIFASGPRNTPPRCNCTVLYCTELPLKMNIKINGASHVQYQTPGTVAVIALAVAVWHCNVLYRMRECDCFYHVCFWSMQNDAGFSMTTFEWSKYDDNLVVGSILTTGPSESLTGLLGENCLKLGCTTGGGEVKSILTVVQWESLTELLGGNENSP